MPTSQYNPLFGGKPGSAKKAKTAMKRTYGPKKGEQVFHATVNKRKGRKRRGLSIEDFQR